jgi:hypothetical protein
MVNPSRFDVMGRVKKNPLLGGYSRETISANIRREMEAGHEQVQAVAMALESAREAWREAHPGKRLPAYLRRRKTAAEVAARYGRRMKHKARPAPRRRRHKNPVDHLIMVIDPTLPNVKWFYDGIQFDTLPSRAARWHQSAQANKVLAHILTTGEVSSKYRFEVIPETALEL